MLQRLGIYLKQVNNSWKGWERWRRVPRSVCSRPTWSRATASGIGEGQDGGEGVDAVLATHGDSWRNITGEGACPASPRAESCPQTPVGSSAPISTGWTAPDPSVLFQGKVLGPPWCRSMARSWTDLAASLKQDSDSARLQDCPGTKLNSSVMCGRPCQPQHLPVGARHLRDQPDKAARISRLGPSRWKQGKSSPDLKRLMISLQRPLCLRLTIWPLLNLLLL